MKIQLSPPKIYLVQTFGIFLADKVGCVKHSILCRQEFSAPKPPASIAGTTVKIFFMPKLIYKG
jgi:hypothetical protein